MYCDWVYTRWQWSVNLYKNGKETTKYKSEKTTENVKENIEYTK